MKSKALLIILSVFLSLSSFTKITDEELLAMGISQEELNEMKQDKFKGQTGTIKFNECHASLQVPNDLCFLDIDQSKRLLIDYWNNPESHIKNLLGVLVPNSCSAYYQISIAYVITYDNCGYVKDDDANNIDYTTLLKQLQEAAIEDNKSLPEEQRCILKGWAVSPKYLAGSHVLVWAKDLVIGGVETINYDMRILGKDGLVSINAVIPPEERKNVIDKESEIIECLSYNNGYAYTDFDPSRDHSSEWTIGGLVAGSILAKSGAFAKIGLFFLKFWKMGIVAIAGIGAAIAKLFRKKEDE